MHPVISPRGLLMIAAFLLMTGWLVPWFVTAIQPKGRKVLPRAASSDAVVTAAPRSHTAGALVARLDQHWDTISTVQARENPDGFTGFHPPATDDEIAAAEDAVGFDFPAELRWLLRKHNGQDADSDASFINGSMLMEASLIAEDYEMVKDIHEDLDVVAGPDERPEKGGDSSWWPELLPFAIDAGGDHWYIDARTSLVYSEFEGSISLGDVSSGEIEVPLTFSAWLGDYAQRLNEREFWLDPGCPGVLWMWHLDHFREP